MALFNDTIGGVLGGQPDFDWVSGNYYHGGDGGSGVQKTNVVIQSATGLATFTPLFVHKQFTADRLALYLSGASASNLRLGIYNDNGLTPIGGSLVDETAAIAVSGGADYVGTISATLTPGVYWLAANQDGSITGDGWGATTNNVLWPWSNFLPDGTNHGVNGFRMAMAFGAFTDPLSGTPATADYSAAVRIRAQ